MSVDKLVCKVIKNSQNLELCFNESFNSKSPILSYSRGFFYFFNTFDKFEKFSRYLACKPFYDKKFNRMKREIVGAYPCDLIQISDNIYFMDKQSSCDMSYFNLQKRILSYVESNSSLVFDDFNGIYIGK